MYLACIFTTCLKTEKVIRVYKKGPVTKAENYRPVFLLPTIAKAFEKILLTRLLSFFNQNSILQDTQYGFRKKHNTIHAVLDVITQLYDNIANNKFSCILTLDLKKAFDTVKHDILLGKLEHYWVRGICNTLLHSYLKNRNQFFSFQNNYSSLKSLSCGVPQGSILGPFLFLVYINDLPNALSNKPRLYADNNCLTVTSSSIDNLQLLYNSVSQTVFRGTQVFHELPQSVPRLPRSF